MLSANSYDTVLMLMFLPSQLWFIIDSVKAFTQILNFFYSDAQLMT